MNSVSIICLYHNPPPHPSEKDAAAIIKTIAEAVEYCHASQVVHRDIKPENIMLSENGVLKLGDFGLADFYTPGIGFNKCCGTVSYMAPEVVRWSQKNCNFGMTPAKYGPEVDIWSIGVILHLLLSGSLPFCNDESLPFPLVFTR